MIGRATGILFLIVIIFLTVFSISLNLSTSINRVNFLKKNKVKLENKNEYLRDYLGKLEKRTLEEKNNLQKEIDVLRQNDEQLRQENNRLRQQLISRGKKRIRIKSRKSYKLVSLEKIANCESKGNYKAQNKISSASGKYQFLDSTWRSITGLSGSAKDYPPHIQDQAAQKLYSISGTKPWLASKNCWGK